MALEAILALGGPIRSISRRVVNWLFLITILCHCHSKRGYGDEIQKPIEFMIPSTGSGLGFGGCGMHNGCDFLD